MIAFAIQFMCKEVMPASRPQQESVWCNQSPERLPLPLNRLLSHPKAGPQTEVYCQTRADREPFALGVFELLLPYQVEESNQFVVFR